MVAALALLVLLLVVAGWLCGTRYFVVQSPSMAETAPVGTLVVTTPLTGRANVGEVVAFEPPGLHRVYTHRVVAVLPNGSIRTQGDLNGARDAWTTPSTRVLGHAVAVIPVVGFLLESAPTLLIGAVALILLTKLLRRHDHRVAARVLGAHLLVAVIVALRHPFVALTVVATQTTGRHLNAIVVSTGVLPTKISSGARTVAHLIDGQLATIPIPHSNAGQTALQASLDLTWWQYALLLTATMIPAGLFLIIDGRATHQEDTGRS